MLRVKGHSTLFGWSSKQVPSRTLATKRCGWRVERGSPVLSARRSESSRYLLARFSCLHAKGKNVNGGGTRLSVAFFHSR